MKNLGFGFRANLVGNEGTALKGKVGCISRVGSVGGGGGGSWGLSDILHYTRLVNSPHYGPFLGTLNNRGRLMIVTSKGSTCREITAWCWVI